MDRRNLIKSLAVTAASAAVYSGAVAAPLADENMEIQLKGNIKHSVASWTYGFLPLDTLCALLKKLRVGAIDLLAPKDFETAKKYGLEVSMCYTNGTTSLTEGFNDTKNHDWLVKDYLEAIPIIAKAGFKNLICFSGNRNGMDDKQGLANCVIGLKKILPLAEQNGITIQMELFNSRIDHKDYMCDKSAWGIELCKQLGSNNFKLLFDIYHMQINEGDIIRSIKDNHQYFGHYHTAGVPGRHEIDTTQELNYPAIMNAIIASGYKGFVAQEFIPSGADNKAKIKALKQAIKICDV
jgi:hydroxypyruvate isomerase